MTNIGCVEDQGEVKGRVVRCEIKHHQQGGEGQREGEGQGEGDVCEWMSDQHRVREWMNR